MPVSSPKKNYKHQDLYQYVMRRIRDGIYKPGELIDSEQALAMRLNLSRNTVRQALARLELDGYVYRKQGKGTFLKENADRESRKIAMMVTDIEKIGDPVTVNMVRGLKNVFTPAGYTLEILTGNTKLSDKDIQRMDQTYCGILLGSTRFSAENLAALETCSRPFFFIKNYPDEYADRAVKINYEKVGYLSAEHLINENRRNLALIGSSENFTIGKNYVTGIKNACLEYGARLAHDAIFLCGYNDMEEARKAVHAILKLSPRPDGIIAACDEIAICVMRELKKNGVNVPEDIAIIGCNDIDVAPLISPSLSSIHLPMTRLGEQSAHVMLKMLHGDKYSFPELIPELRIRESSV